MDVTQFGNSQRLFGHFKGERFLALETYMCREVDEFITLIFKTNLLSLIKYFTNIVTLI